MLNKGILILIFFLPGCYQEIDIQINPYICIGGFQWDLEGNPIVNDFGAQETCVDN